MLLPHISPSRIKTHREELHPSLGVPHPIHIGGCNSTYRLILFRSNTRILPACLSTKCVSEKDAERRVKKRESPVQGSSCDHLILFFQVVKCYMRAFPDQINDYTTATCEKHEKKCERLCLYISGGKCSFGGSEVRLKRRQLSRG